MQTKEHGETAESSLDELLKAIETLEGLVATWDERERNVVQALLVSVDALNKEAFTRVIRALMANPAALSAMNEVVTDKLVYTVLRHHELIKPSLQERVEKALDSVRPFLRGHGGDVELLSIEPPQAVTIRLRGACNNCPSSEMTLKEGVEKAIKEQCPEITEIKRAPSTPLGECSSGQAAVNFVSPFAKGAAVESN
jgi:Fe-S cluster biogenesis protein NfuA